MKWSVRAKSGTSLLRATKKRIDITLRFPVRILISHSSKACAKVHDGEREEGKGREAYPNKEFNNHTKPNIQPTVVSPLKLRQLSTRSMLKLLPATSTVNRIRAVAAAYQMVCRRAIWERIFSGGSSVRAPGRGGRRRRAMAWGRWR